MLTVYKLVDSLLFLTVFVSRRSKESCESCGTDACAKDASSFVAAKLWLMVEQEGIEAR